MPDIHDSKKANKPVSKIQESKLKTLNSFAEKYAREAFSQWSPHIEKVISELSHGRNVVLCANSGIGKTNFGLPEIAKRWEAIGQNGAADIFEDGIDLRWTVDVDVAIVDEAKRFCIPPQKNRIEIERYSTRPESDALVGVNGSIESLPYILKNAKAHKTLIVLVAPENNPAVRDEICSRLEDFDFSVVNIGTLTFDESIIEQFLKDLGLGRELSNRITSDRFLMNPTVFSNYIIEILRDGITNGVEMTVPNFEDALRYWCDPHFLSRPEWCKERTDDPWATLEDEPLWRLELGIEDALETFVESLGLDLSLLRDHGMIAQISSRPGSLTYRVLGPTR